MEPIGTAPAPDPDRELPDLGAVYVFARLHGGDHRLAVRFDELERARGFAATLRAPSPLLVARHVDRAEPF